MIALIQRVSFAKVVVNSETIGAIDHGILALVCVEKEDTDEQPQKLLNKVLNYRIFADDQDRMSLNVGNVNGGLLLVPQFTLAANTSKGTKPSFSKAAPPEMGKRLFDNMVTLARGTDVPISTGQFGADMQVQLQNEGPVTFWLQV
ncbi:MAG: D-tyrosyl-tRNA(Tyr) deacylase [Methylococcales bacterium]|nr:D-tyrosyl-tRNA(Tyr) deacylase [Methylococcales bacterium]MBT7444319.1 D-tyrosyl-tRNA(Tyr) deacylase [Methylococcales bacterium]